MTLSTGWCWTSKARFRADHYEAFPKTPAGSFHISTAKHEANSDQTRRIRAQCEVKKLKEQGPSVQWRVFSWIKLKKTHLNYVTFSTSLLNRHWPYKQVLLDAILCSYFHCQPYLWLKDDVIPKLHRVNECEREWLCLQVLALRLTRRLSRMEPSSFINSSNNLHCWLDVTLSAVRWITVYYNIIITHNDIYSTH